MGDDDVGEELCKVCMCKVCIRSKGVGNICVTEKSKVFFCGKINLFKKSVSCSTQKGLNLVIRQLSKKKLKKLYK